MFELLFGHRQNPASTVVAEPPRDRKAELTQEIRALDIELGDCDAAILTFRRKNLALVNGVLVLQYPAGTDTGAARADIEKGWAALCKEREEIQKKRNAVLPELARFS